MGLGPFLASPDEAASGTAVTPRTAATWGWPSIGPWGTTGLFLLTAVSYAAGSRLALELIETSGLSGVFFIPAGITVAFLLRLPRHKWWVVLAGAAVAEAAMDLLAGLALAETAGFVVANTLEPLVGALVVARFTAALDLARLRHVWAFLVGAVIVGAAVGALVGAGTDRLLGGDAFFTTFWQWWLGDALGVLIIGTGILVWGSSPDRRSLTSSEGLVLLAGTSLLTLGILYLSDFPLLYLELMAIVVAGAFFGVRAVSVIVLIVTTGIALFIAFDEGAFDSGLSEGYSDATALIIVKLRLGMFSLAGFVLAAEANERESAISRSVDALTRARLAEADRRVERQIALRLQRALLPDRVDAPHDSIAVAARYEASSEALIVGGDWYDVIYLPDGSVGVTVGDVVGHGLEATAAMGKMRTAVAALALNTGSPGRVLSQLDEFAAASGAAEFATACYSILDPAAGELRFASAGHPPMLLIDSDGSASWLLDGRSAPIHEGVMGDRPEARIDLTPGAVLLAYSDGLIERRGETMDQGLNRLMAEAVSRRGLAVEDLCDRLLEALIPDEGWRDDVVVVAVRYESAPGVSSPSP